MSDSKQYVAFYEVNLTQTKRRYVKWQLQEKISNQESIT